MKMKNVKPGMIIEPRKKDRQTGVTYRFLVYDIDCTTGDLKYIDLDYDSAELCTAEGYPLNMKVKATQMPYNDLIDIARGFNKVADEAKSTAQAFFEMASNTPDQDSTEAL